MQDSKSKVPEGLKLKGEETKRTTIILERSEREFVESLIEQGKEPGIKALISKMLDIYKSLNVVDWHFPGEYYCGISRMAFVNVELLNILSQQIPKEKMRVVGIQMGNALKVSIQSTLGVDASVQENWGEVFKRLKVQGFGDFYLKDKFLVLKTPFIHDCDIWIGLIEGLFNIQSEIRNCVPPLVFEIKARR
jgi:hypothetical protein